MANRHTYTNRLVNQKSPYLLQHAHNPVDWYPWGDEAFHAAKEQDKPIFLSIGYATCHWCHVMERESFESLAIAQMMNEAFINVKVDREELPEVDSLYMEFAQGMMSGAAGWPLNLILTPELQPFFAATYLPPHNKHGQIGLVDLVMRIQDVWKGEERETVLSQAAQVVEIFASNIHTQGDEIAEKEDVQEVAELLFKMADPVYGGLKGTPKFPVGYQYSFLLRYGVKMNDGRAQFLVERTLEMMHNGGIYDHLGGGFSRYSIDEHWMIPHFEKMLYDNAMLAQSYLEAWLLTQNPLFKETCQETLDYVLREMTDPLGGFYSAQDAETEGREGYYYTWTVDEIKDVLGPTEGRLFCELFNVTELGNFEGRNVLYMKESIKEFAEQHGGEEEEWTRRFAEQRRRLWEARNKRTAPFKDDKVLSSWNGLMIATLIEAGVAFGNKRYTDAAKKAAHFIHSNLWVDGQLLRRWREGEVNFVGGLDEYAFMIRALLNLFDTDGKSEWLEWAIEMTQILESRFKAEGGAYYQTDGQDPHILIRRCQFSDGAEPSGNAVHCENLLRLYQLTLNEQFLNQAVDVLKAVKSLMDNYAPGYCYHVMNINRYFDKKAPTFVISLNAQEEHGEALKRILFSQFIPHRAIIWRHEDDQKLFNILPFVKQQTPIDGKTTLYICYEGRCQKPLNNFEEMVAAISKK